VLDDPWWQLVALAGLAAVLGLVLRLVPWTRPVAGLAAPASFLASGLYHWGLPAWPPSDLPGRILAVGAAGLVLGLAADTVFKNIGFLRRGLLVAFPVLAGLWVVSRSLGSWSQITTVVVAGIVIALIAIVAIAHTETDSSSADNPAQATVAAAGLGLVALASGEPKVAEMAWQLVAVSAGATIGSLAWRESPGFAFNSGVQTPLLASMAFLGIEEREFAVPLVVLLLVLLTDRFVLLPTGGAPLAALARTFALLLAGAALSLAALALAIAAGGTMPLPLLFAFLR